MALSARPVDFGGDQRRMLVAAPGGPTSSLTLSLHGSRSTPVREALLSHMEPWAERGVVVAFPEGSLPSGSGSEWDLQADVAFLEAAVEQLREEFQLSSPRLCLTGMSGGARMASRYASLHRDEVAVLGAVAGLRPPACTAVAHPLPRRGLPRDERPHQSLWGKRDGPMEGERDGRATAWARSNGVPAEPREDQVSATLSRVSFGPDDGPGAVTLWVSKGAGHTWPGSRLPLLYRLFLGRTSFEIGATAEIWRAQEKA